MKEKGFREMKTQLALPGETTPAIEVDRMRRVREAIGPDIKLMCDINQRWRVEQAIDIGRRVEDAGVGLFWLEDVTTADDYAGLARVTAALSTPVAGGEYVWGIVPFRHMVEARSVDVVMIDLVRVGGITQWIKVAGMAEAFNLPVVSHLIPEVHVHLIGAIPNGLTVEYMPWLMRLFEEVPQPANGELAMPTAPGSASNSTKRQSTATKPRSEFIPFTAGSPPHARHIPQLQEGGFGFRCEPLSRNAGEGGPSPQGLAGEDCSHRERRANEISHINSQILVLPEADPLANSPENPNAARPIVIVRMGTDDGIEGIAVTFYGGAMTRSLKAAVDDLGALDRRRPAAPRSDHRQTARRGGRLRAREGCSPWRCRRSTSRCGTFAARRWTSRYGSCWAVRVNASLPMRAARCAAA